MRSHSKRVQPRSLLGAVIALLMLGAGSANADWWDYVPPPEAGVNTSYQFLTSAEAWYDWDSPLWQWRPSSGSFWVVAGSITVGGETTRQAPYLEVPSLYGTAEVFISGSVPAPCGSLGMNNSYTAPVVVDIATGVVHATVTGIKDVASCDGVVTSSPFVLNVNWVAKDIPAFSNRFEGFEYEARNEVRITRAAISAGAWQWVGKIPLAENEPYDLLSNAAQLNFALLSHWNDGWNPAN